MRRVTTASACNGYMKVLKKIWLLFTLLFLFSEDFLGTAVCSAEGGTTESLLEAYLRDHQEYQYACIVDLNADGRDEMLAASHCFMDEGFIEVILIVPSGNKVSVFPIRSYYSYISYDPFNHCIVGSGGGTGAFSYILVTMDKENVYEWMVGYENGFSPDNTIYRKYDRTLYRLKPDSDGVEGRLRLRTEPIEEHEFQRYVEWFEDFPPVSLSPVDSICGLSASTTSGTEIPVKLPKTSASFISAGGQHTAFLRDDGTVACIGGNENGQKDVNSWNHVVKICAGIQNTVGLCSDGTVLAVGNNQFGQCDTGLWRGITDISTQNYHTLGLRDDGTVAAVGFNDWGECNVESWEYIKQISSGEYHSVGLDEYGAVYSAGDNRFGQCDVSGWYGIETVDAGYNHTVGLTDRGNVVATGKNNRGQCNVSGWRDVRQVSAGGEHTVALLKDGTVVATGNNDFGQCNVSGWHDIVQISAGYYHTVGMMSDGKLVAVGWAEKGQCDVEQLR